MREKKYNHYVNLENIGETFQIAVNEIFNKYNNREIDTYDIEGLHANDAKNALFDIYNQLDELILFINKAFIQHGIDNKCSTVMIHNDNGLLFIRKGSAKMLLESYKQDTMINSIQPILQKIRKF
jgi:uncharacterized protein YdcH (DUF465 family)